MTATDTIPEIDVWSWTRDGATTLGSLLDVKRAVLVHHPLRGELERELGSGSHDARTEGLARWMLAQYHRAWELLANEDESDPVIAFARAECCLKGRIAVKKGIAMRRPDLAATNLAKHPALASEPRVYALYLDALLFDHEVQKAQDALADAPAEIQDGAVGAYVHGRAAESQADYRTAKSHYLKALENDPGHRGALLRLAYQHDLGGDDEEAMEYYKRLTALRPLDVHAVLNYGVLLEDHAQFQEAIALYRKVLRKEPL